MATTPVTEAAFEDLAGVIWRLWTASDEVAALFGPGGDLARRRLALGATLAATNGLDLLQDRARLCDVPASQERDPALLIREVEAKLASRPIEQWPEGTSTLIVAVCDLIREHQL